MQNIRDYFPSIVKDEHKAFFENAGGTQIPRHVTDRMLEHMQNYNVQIDGLFEEARDANRLAQVRENS